MQDNDTILGDITVLDVSQSIAGPYCTKLLAALGARVIKIEPPLGDMARHMGPFFHDEPHPEKNGSFLYLNTSKESITLNLERSSGAALLKRLLLIADILVESYPPGVMAGWGLGFRELSALQPDLIYTSITPFGQTGPYSDYKGSEIVLEALSALLYTVGLPEREPLKLGGSPALMTGGVSAFSAIMVALHNRDETGEGELIDVSLMESTVVSQIHSSLFAQFGGHDPIRRASQLSKTKDGWVNIGIQNASWKEFSELIGRPELLEDPRFMDEAARRTNATALNEVLADWLADQNKVDVYHKLQAMRSIAGHVSNMADLFQSEQYQARGFFRLVDHPVTGALPYPGPAFQIDDLPWRQERAPSLGEHTEAVLHSELGLPKAELARLRAQGVI